MMQQPEMLLLQYPGVLCRAADSAEMEGGLVQEILGVQFVLEVTGTQ